MINHARPFCNTFFSLVPAHGSDRNEHSLHGVRSSTTKRWSTEAGRHERPTWRRRRAKRTTTPGPNISPTAEWGFSGTSCSGNTKRTSHTSSTSRRTAGRRSAGCCSHKRWCRSSCGCSSGGRQSTKCQHGKNLSSKTSTFSKLLQKTNKNMVLVVNSSVQKQNRFEK